MGGNTRLQRLKRHSLQVGFSTTTKDVPPQPLNRHRRGRQVDVDDIDLEVVEEPKSKKKKGSSENTPPPFLVEFEMLIVQR